MHRVYQVTEQSKEKAIDDYELQKDLYNDEFGKIFKKIQQEANM